jgi:hypothetical protein
MAYKGNASFAQFYDQSVSINGLDKSATKSSMHFHGQPYDLFSQRIVLLRRGKNPVFHSVNLENLEIP